MKFPCPKCEQPGISVKDKYRLSYWCEAYCSHCRARVSANPWFLAPYSLVYMWAMATCAFIYLFQDAGMMAFVYAAVAWVVIDFLNVVLIPMSVLRSLEPPDSGLDAAPDVGTDGEQSGKQTL